MGGGGRIKQWLKNFVLLPDGPCLIPGILKIVSDEKLSMLLRLINGAA